MTAAASEDEGTGAGRDPEDAPGAWTWSASGGDPDRVLVFDAGVLLADHADGDGRPADLRRSVEEIAERLAGATGRGADVTALVRAPATPLLDAVRDFEPANYDVVVVPFAPAGRAETAIEHNHRLRMVAEDIARLRPALHPGAEVVVVAMPTPLARAAAEGGEEERTDPAPDGRTASVARSAERTETVRAVDAVHVEDDAAAPPVSRRVTVVDAGEADDRCGRLLAALEGLLAAQRAGTDSPQRWRSEPQSPLDRHAAIDRIGVLDAPHDARLDRIVRRMSELFGTRSAAITFLPAGRQVTKAGVGTAMGDSPLEESFCLRTVQHDGAFVVGDAREHPDEVPQTDIRFYAGHPLETVDGVRIGAVCVFDSEPRAASSVEVDLLREYAVLVREELYRSGARP